MTTMIGTRIYHYRIEKHIGKGGMGAIYKARDTKLDRPVVLKFLQADMNRSKEYRERLLREAKASSALNHPNIVTIYEINEWKGRLFICMEYIDGKTLGKFCYKQRLPIPVVLDTAIQIASAVNIAHKNGIMHRDIKCSNIIVTNDNLVKVFDFGIAKLKDSTSLTQKGSFVGTPAYCAPEILRGLTVDFRSDIFSLGIVFYEMVAGRMPFSGESLPALMYAVVNKTPESFLSLGRMDVPSALEKVIFKALAKTPEKRFHNLDELLNILQSLKNGLAAPARSKPWKQDSEIPDEETETQDLNPVENITTSRITLQPVDLDDLARNLINTKLSPGENPYLNRVMIRDPDNFYGRKSECTRIYARIAAASRPQSVSIVGERRIGKSSFLQYLYHPETRKKHLPHPEKCVFAFVDFQDEPILSVENFFKCIFNAFRREYQGNFKLPISEDYQGFRSLVQAFDAHSMRMILLFDEFEMVTTNPVFEPDFFAFFRSMANKYNVAYIVTTVRDLQSLCYSQEIATSPFFNIFSNLNLGPFKPEEARELITKPSLLAEYSLNDFIDDILNFAGPFPFYLQIACSAFFELVKSGYVKNPSMLREAKKIFLEEAEVHFNNTWRKFKREEQSLLTKIILNKKISESEEYLLNKLTKESYVIQHDNKYRMFSETFREYLRLKIHPKKFRWWPWN